MSAGPFDLTGKVALVTGTSRGLGQYMGRALARAGSDLVITSRKVGDLEPFRAEIEALGRRAFPVELDVRDYDSIQRATSAALEQYGKIDILVNNAGLNVRKPAVAISWDDWNLVLETNLRGEFFVAQAVARDSMTPRNYGRIPMRRPGAPADLDGAVVFLASDASEYFTGQTMLVDGGISTGATRATVATKQI